MAMKSLKRWIPVVSLAVAPLAYAQSSEAMDSVRQAASHAVVAATPVKSVEEQQIDDLRKELDAVRSDLNAQREQEDRRLMVIGDPDSHSLWP